MERTKGCAKLSTVEMYYETAGQGEPLLLIHGIDSDSRLWDEQFEVFAEHFRTIRYDLRGFGNTPMPAGDFQALDDIYELLNHLDVDRAHIVGYSYGGTMLPSFTIKYPHKVKSMVLAGAGMVGHTWSEPLMEYFRKFQDELQAKNYGEMMRLLKWKSVYGPHREETGLDHVCDKLELMFMHALNKPREGRPLPTGDTRDQLTQISVPTLILTGEMDFPDYHAIAGFYEGRIPGSKRKILPGAGHMLNIENPALFNEAIIGFIN